MRVHRRLPDGFFFLVLVAGGALWFRRVVVCDGGCLDVPCLPPLLLPIVDDGDDDSLIVCDPIGS